VVQRIALRDAAGTLADHDAELAFEHDLAVAARLADQIAGVRERVRRLQQIQRLGRHRELELLAQGCEVVPQRDDLARLAGHQQLDAGHREQRAGGLGGAVHVAAVHPYRLALERAETDPASLFEAHPAFDCSFHGIFLGTLG